MVAMPRVYSDQDGMTQQKGENKRQHGPRTGENKEGGL